MSKLMDGEYCVLMETSSKEGECWYYFIRKQGNEEALKQLFDDIESVEWYEDEDLSIFTLDIDRPVSATTAKEMTRLQLNVEFFHRKFDGKLKPINFGFKKKDDDYKKMCRVFDLLGYGGIDEYISDEDIDSTVEYDDESGETDESSISSSDDYSSSSEDDENIECNIAPRLL